MFGVFATLGNVGIALFCTTILTLLLLLLLITGEGCAAPSTSLDPACRTSLSPATSPRPLSSAGRNRPRLTLCFFPAVNPCAR